MGNIENVKKIYWSASVYFDIVLQQGGQNLHHIKHQQLHSSSDVMEHEMAPIASLHVYCGTGNSVFLMISPDVALWVCEKKYY